jgi:Nucleotidyl transferase AbiEii toxin, Type IV TA system
MFFNTLPAAARIVFTRLGELPEVAQFYLAGGSSLALQLGHRISVDLDFFSSQEFDTQRLSERLKSIGNLVIEQQSRGNLIGYLNETQFSFFFYDYALLTPTTEFEGIRLASVAEIGLMKLIAIGQRGRRRDFIDLFFIVNEGFTIDYLLSQTPGKYQAISYPSYHLIRALAYFDDAEIDPMPKMLKPFNWEEAKKYFQSESARLAKQL